VTEEKGLEKKRVIESEGSGLKEAEGLGGAQSPPEARRDGRQRLGGAQPPPEARRDGREGFGKEKGD